MKKLLLAIIVCSLALFATAGTASAKTPTLKSLAKSLAALQKQESTISSKLTGADATIASLKSKLTGDEATIASLQSAANADGSAIAGLQGSHVMALNPYLSVTSGAINGVTGPNVVLTGCNLQVRSSTSEGDFSGLGNLIVGWDDTYAPGGTPPAGYRTGSNNLVVGDENDFQAHGEFVVGYGNTVESDFASVTGGENNIASGPYASVCGGSSNTASVAWASVDGGVGNTASGWCSTVGGGGELGAHITESNEDGWAAGNSGTAVGQVETPKYEAH
jgi:hypothetical protein